MSFWRERDVYGAIPCHKVLETILAETFCLICDYYFQVLDATHRCEYNHHGPGEIRREQDTDNFSFSIDFLSNVASMFDIPVVHQTMGYDECFYIASSHPRCFHRRIPDENENSGIVDSLHELECC